MPVIIRGRRVMFLQSKPDDGPRPVKKPPCEYCGKQGHPFAPSWGSSGILRDNILKGHEADVHPWYTGRWSIAAHHLICSEAMADDEVWARFCREGDVRRYWLMHMWRQIRRMDRERSDFRLPRAGFSC